MGAMGPAEVARADGMREREGGRGGDRLGGRRGDGRGRGSRGDVERLHPDVQRDVAAPARHHSGYGE